MPEAGVDQAAYRARSQYRGKVAAQYDADRQRTRYDRFKWGRERDVLARTLKQLTPGGRVLDAPTGTGRLLDMIGGCASLVVGADISSDMLHIASESSDQPVPLVLSEAERLPFRDDAFDAVVSIRFFQHLPTSQVIPILSEMERVSRLGVLVQAPIRKVTSAPIHFASDTKRFLLHRGPGPRPPFRSQRPPNRFFPVPKRDFERALGEAGLALSSSTFVTWPGAQLTLMHVVRV